MKGPQKHKDMGMLSSPSSMPSAQKELKRTAGLEDSADPPGEPFETRLAQQTLKLQGKAPCQERNGIRQRGGCVTRCLIDAVDQKNPSSPLFLRTKVLPDPPDPLKHARNRFIRAVDISHHDHHQITRRRAGQEIDLTHLCFKPHTAMLTLDVDEHAKLRFQQLGSFGNQVSDLGRIHRHGK